MDFPLWNKMKLPRLELPKKPVYEKLDTDLDFFTIFSKIEHFHDTCFILESMGEETVHSRYSVIGFSPQMVIRAREKTLYINDIPYAVDNPYYSLREIIPDNSMSRNYAGGLVGYLSYDCMNYFEPRLGLKLHEDFDQFVFGVYTDGLVLDKMTGQMRYFYYTENRLAEIQKIIQTEIPDIADPVVEMLGHQKSKEEHKACVLSVIEEIKAGNTFQCQMGFRTNFKITGSTVPIYKQLREINPSPYMFYLKFSEKKIIGASPELVFRLRQGEMETFPLAGTTARGKNEEEDRALARGLLNDPKEIAEHNMLIDLHRNDIGRVARFGTVKVRRQFDIKRFSHVQHISSEVVGIISKDHDMFSGLASSFPAGTLSGAPKIESMKIIDRIEKAPRGPYGGAVGHFGFNGDCTFSIPIRTLFVNGNKAFVRASGGIVYDSLPENEYQEILNKMGAVLAALKEFM